MIDIHFSNLHESIYNSKSILLVISLQTIDLSKAILEQISKTLFY